MPKFWGIIQIKKKTVFQRVTLVIYNFLIYYVKTSRKNVNATRNLPTSIQI